VEKDFKEALRYCKTQFEASLEEGIAEKHVQGAVPPPQPDSIPSTADQEEHGAIEDVEYGVAAEGPGYPGPPDWPIDPQLTSDGSHADEHSEGSSDMVTFDPAQSHWSAALQPPVQSAPQESILPRILEAAYARWREQTTPEGALKMPLL
jgi:hypothetical protein